MLKDWLRPDLSLLSVGLNPSPISVARGYYFANPRNRFWRAFTESGLAGGPLTPGIEAHEMLCATRGIGFTDVVKRTTPGLKDLRPEDFRRDAPRLQQIIEDLRPRVVWFHGRVAYDRYRQALGLPFDDVFSWGAQSARMGGSRVYVTPNPSPANAAFSLPVLVEAYRALQVFVWPK